MHLCTSNETTSNLLIWYFSTCDEKNKNIYIFLADGEHFYFLVHLFICCCLSLYMLWIIPSFFSLYIHFLSLVFNGPIGNICRSSIAYWVRSWDSGPDCVDSNPSSATNAVGDCKMVTSPFWVYFLIQQMELVMLIEPPS